MLCVACRVVSRCALCDAYGGLLCLALRLVVVVLFSSCVSVFACSCVVANGSALSCVVVCCRECCVLLYAVVSGCVLVCLVVSSCVVLVL